jgi:hypothetical protein
MLQPASRTRTKIPAQEREIKVKPVGRKAGILYPCTLFLNRISKLIIITSDKPYLLILANLKCREEVWAQKQPPEGQV